MHSKSMKNVFSQSASLFHTHNTGSKHLKTSALLSLMLLFSAWVVAQTSTWTGAVSTNWNAAGNWNPMGLPGATSEVVIPGTTNKPVISLGTNVVIKSLEIKSNGQLTIQAGASLNLKGPDDVALTLSQGCSLDNYGVINVGLGNAAGFTTGGILLSGKFTNHAGAATNIDKSSGSAIYQTGDLSVNKGEINIGFTPGSVTYGIYSLNNPSGDTKFVNDPSGVISIDHTSQKGIHLQYTVFENFGKIEMGTWGPVGQQGLYMSGWFLNRENATLKINRSAVTGIYIDLYGELRNYSTVQLGNTHTIGTEGIHNENGSFYNFAGEVTINRASEYGIFHNSYIGMANYALIKIGTVASNVTIGIVNNKGTFENKPEGEIKIDRVSNTAVYILDKMVNEGKLYIGSSNSAGATGIFNSAKFLNTASGLVTIDNFGTYGIFNDKSAVYNGDVENHGLIRIGDQAGGSYPIYNEHVFENRETGEIFLNRFVESGIFQTSGNFMVNKGKLKIGKDGPAGKYGVNVVSGGFNNIGEGEVTVYQATIAGIENNTGVTFSNFGQVFANNSPGGISLINKGLYINQRCARTTIFGALSNPGSINNVGHFEIAGTEPLSITGTFNNLGVLSHQFNNSIPQQAINNNGIISQLVSVNCTTVNPALTISPANYMTISTAWTNIVSEPAAVFNAATNTLQVTDPAFLFFYTVTDPAGSCNHQVLISANYADAVPPAVQCKNTTLPLNAGATYVDDSAITQSVSDNCGIMFSKVTPNGFGCSHLGANTVKLEVRDFAGNTATCNAVVTVVDATAPQVTCKNVNKTLNAAGTTSVSTSEVLLSVTDNCSAITLVSVTPAAFTCANLGSNTAILKVSDASGNTSTCLATVIVSDPIAPTVLCKSANISLNASGQATLPAASVYQTASDNCSQVTITSVTPAAFTCANLGANTVTLKVSDASGNTATCQASVTVTDGIAPTMLCKSATVALNASGQATLSTANINNGSFDNCSIVTLELNQTQFGCANLGANNIILTGSDAAGNKAQCFATVTVTDPIAPVAKCKNTTLNLGADGTAAVSTTALNNGSSDNCSFALSATPATLNCGNLGANTVVLKATDTAGNTGTCTALVTVKDVTAPVAKCKNATVFLNDVGQGTLTAAMVNNNSTDACGITNITLSKTQFNCSEIPGSAQVITMTLRDASNNTASCLAYVTVKDNLAPTAICENTTVSLGANGSVTVYPSQLADNSFDNCSVWSYSPTAKVYTSANLGVNNLTITVKDWSNNAATCVSQVTVVPFNNAGGNTADRNENATETALPATTEVDLFPNPADHLVHFRFEAPEEASVALRLYDLNGRVVLQAHINAVAGENIYDLPLQEIPAGVYLAELQSDAVQARKRLVVQR
jgi:hypothetical protein